MENLKDCDTVTIAQCDKFDEPCKFLTKDFDLVNYQFIKKRLTQNTGFLVVGVIGKQSVGKSFILNMLANNYEKDNSNNVPFQTANKSDLINFTQKTNGIDIHVTSDRVILLDAQPVLSLNHLAVPMEKEKKIKVYSNEDSDNEGKLKMTLSPDILTVKLMSYFLSVCHVVLVIDQNILNYRILRLLDLAYRLKPWIPCNPQHLPLDEPNSNIVHSELHDEFHDYMAQVIFVENMSTMAVVSADRTAQCLSAIEGVMLGYRARISEQKMLHAWLGEMKIKEKMLHNKRLKQKKLQQQRDKLMSDPSAVLQLEGAKSETGSENEGASPDGAVDIAVEAVASEDQPDPEAALHTSIERPILLVRVPLFAEKDTNMAKEAASLQRVVFGCLRKHFCVTQNERFTELCWLEYASEMWENTKESQLVVEFLHSYSNIVSNDI